MSVTIYRRDGTVAFVADKATTMREALEQAAKSGADLTYANLSYTNLVDATLVGANLSRANLTAANIYGATLARADLAHANLTGANLYAANLVDADLTRANLHGADLTAANIYGANLTRAVGVHYTTIGPVDGWVVALTLTSEGLRISAGCRYFSVPEAREHWGDPTRWSEGASPEHGAKMLAAVNALLALAADWPVQLPEASR